MYEINYLSHPKFSKNISDCYGAAGGKWLSALPRIVKEISEDWSLVVEPPFPNLSYNFVAPCVCNDRKMVLKIAFCAENSEIFDELRLLKYFDGQTAVRVFRFDETRCAMLLERLIPGENLLKLFAGDEERAVEIAIKVLKKFWREPPQMHDFPRLEKWIDGLRRGENTAFPQKILTKTRSIFERLDGEDSQKFILHGDFHHENILSAQREPFLLIDPKGIIGGRGYDIAVFLNNHANWQASAPNLKAKLNAAVKEFSRAFDIELEVLKKWAYAQAVLSAFWTFEDNSGNWRFDLTKAEIWE